MLSPGDKPDPSQTGHVRQNSDLNKSQDQNQPSLDQFYSSQQQPVQQLQPERFNNNVPVEKISKVGSGTPEVVDPLYSNQPLQPRSQTSLLDLDWLSPMYDPNASLKKQLEQVRSFKICLPDVLFCFLC